MNKVFLCHKCSGCHVPHDNLFNYCCISGYYRGFEPALTPLAAACEQTVGSIKDLIWYVDVQKRPQYEIEQQLQRVNRSLLNIQKFVV